MAWGAGAGPVAGMGGMGGGGPGRGFAAARPEGLPFAGIPPEMAGRVAELVATESARPDPDITFSHQTDDHRRLTIRPTPIPPETTCRGRPPIAHSARNACSAAYVSSGACSAMKWPLGRALPLASTAFSFQKSMVLLKAGGRFPRSAHKARTGQAIFLFQSAWSISRSIPALAR